MLRHERMGWREASAGVGKRVRAGDHLFVYASQRALPGLGGIIVGEAVALEELQVLEPPEFIGTRRLTRGFRLRLCALASPEDAVTLKDLVPDMPVFGYKTNRRSWQGRLQGGLIELAVEDVDVLVRHIRWAPDLDAARQAYLSRTNDKC